MDDSLKFKKLEHQTFQLLSSYIRNKKVLVAVSGGKDSSFLLQLLVRLQDRVNFQIVVAHVFHGSSEMGPSDRSKQVQLSKKFRENAHEFVQQLAGKNIFVANIVNPKTKQAISKRTTDDLGFEFPKNDEQSLRDYRQKVLRKLAHLTGADLIALGHHRDDLLETRLIRLIRGVGPQGLKSMSVKSRGVIRPLLQTWRSDIEVYSQEIKLKYLEDPSNSNSRYLRNWIRNKWIPQLESHRQGGKRSLARSLELLAKEVRKDLSFAGGFVTSEGVDRSAILALTNVEQRQVLATYLKQRNVKNYSASHVDEVLKRLRSSKNTFDFRVAGRVWKVTSTRVRVGD